jgi:hypothetical protein
LNRRVPPAKLTNETTNLVLIRLSSLIFYNQFTPEYNTALGMPVSFQMKAGTVVDALKLGDKARPIGPAVTRARKLYVVMVRPRPVRRHTTDWVEKVSDDEYGK